LKELTIVNISRDRCSLGDKIQVADTILTSFIGLMGRKELAPGAGLLLRGSSSIHTFWMRIPIDALYLDRTFRVKAIDNHLKPWRTGTIRRRIRHVLELPAGTAERLGVKVGDVLALEEKGSPIDLQNTEG
jgi:uncharacterized membrane protein (UPF0127 family)